LPGIIDSHSHLQHPAFDPDRDAVLERAREAGITRIVVPGWDRASSEAAVALAATHPDLLVPAVGIHPHHAAEAAEADWEAIETLAAEPAVGAIGEIGLDFFRLLAPAEAQREALARQLTLAARVGKPVLVHDRDAHEEVTATLAAWPGPPRRALRGVLHCFSGDLGMATRLAAAGYLVSFALPVTFRSAQGPRAAVGALPADAIMVETDAPWLGPGADRRNEPTTVLRVAAEIARLRGEAPATIALGAGRALARLLEPVGA
jgi:TatD DNase family protein